MLNLFKEITCAEQELLFPGVVQAPPDTMPGTLHCTALRCTALHCTALYCTGGSFTTLAFITVECVAVMINHVVLKSAVCEEPLCTGWSLRTSAHHCWLQAGRCTACRGEHCR